MTHSLHRPVGPNDYNIISLPVHTSDGTAKKHPMKWVTNNATHVEWGRESHGHYRVRLPVVAKLPDDEYHTTFHVTKHTLRLLVLALTKEVFNDIIAHLRQKIRGRSAYSQRSFRRKLDVSIIRWNVATGVLLVGMAVAVGLFIYMMLYR